MTHGHEDIVRRAASIFGKVLIAIASNPNKKPMFDVEERCRLAREVLLVVTVVPEPVATPCVKPLPPPLRVRTPLTEILGNRGPRSMAICSVAAR